MIKTNFILCIFFSFSALANYQNPSLKEFLKEFNNDPKKVMNQLPYKSKKIELLTALQLKSKIAGRKKLLSFNKEQISGINNLSILFKGNESILTNAFEIDEKPLKQVKLIESPWSGYYWSTINGLLGNRYADLGFKWKADWEGRLDYITDKPMSTLLDKTKKRDTFSPAEKYDLLIGNYDGPITSVMWEIGKKEIEEFKEIRYWSGLCHGLAMAALKLPRPKYSIKVWSADKKYQIKFYPEDIKALGIYHWSHDSIPLRLLGGRCDINSPETDSIGRIKNPNCRDTNSGSFHLTIVNRIGVQKKSLIMDSARDHEVWNFPIVGYTFNFFNPNNGTKSFKLKNAMISKSDYQNDKFSKYRSSSTEFIVGVEAKIDYLGIRNPKQEDKDSNIPLNSSTYRYDLEIDKDGNIIGGEWYTNANPDFIWFPEDGADPKSPFDQNIISTWDPASKGPLPADWIQSANASAEIGLLSSNIVKALFEYSNKGSN